MRRLQRLRMHSTNTKRWCRFHWANVRVCFCTQKALMLILVGKHLLIHFTTQSIGGIGMRRQVDIHWTDIQLMSYAQAEHSVRMHFTTLGQTDEQVGRHRILNSSFTLDVLTRTLHTDGGLMHDRTSTNICTTRPTQQGFTTWVGGVQTQSQYITKHNSFAWIMAIWAFGYLLSICGFILDLCGLGHCGFTWFYKYCLLVCCFFSRQPTV